MSTQTRAPLVAKKTGLSQTSAVRRHATIPNELTTLPPIMDEALHSPGRPLDAATREFMEPRFGHDLSQVRIHADGGAAASAQAVCARAYTVGTDVFFDANEFAPATPPGRELLAHELTHTIQQRDSGAAPPSPEAHGEIESGARAAGRKIAAGESVSMRLPACGRGLSCSPKDDDEAKRRAAAIAEAQAVATQIDQTENEEDEIPVTPMAIGGVPYNPKPATKVAKKAKRPKSEVSSKFSPGGFTDHDIYGDMDAKKKKEEDAQKAAQQKEDEGRDVRLMALRERLRHGFAKSVLAEMLYTLPMRDLQILKRYGFQWKRRGPDQDSLVEAIDKWAASSDANTPDPKQYGAIVQSEKAYYQRNYANLQNYNQRVEALASSGPASLTGRVIGTAIGGERGGDWGAAIGGGFDAALPVAAAIKGPGSGGGMEEFQGQPAAPISEPFVPETAEEKLSNQPRNEGAEPAPDTTAENISSPNATAAPPTEGSVSEPVIWDLHGNKISESEAASKDHVFVTPGKDGQAGTIHVIRNGRESTFAETNRTIAEQQKRGFLNDQAGGNRLALEELRGKRVLDLAAGTHGKTVGELRDLGIDAYGMDIALSEQAGQSKYLGRADLSQKIPFEGEFDVAYELYGGLAYGMGKSETATAFENAVSHVKPGGTLYLAPLSKNAQDALRPLVESLEASGGKLQRSTFHAEDEIWRVTMPPKKGGAK